ncbi:penicillin-binding transpeptidase domain-containing protein [Roseburia hominis]
MKHKKGANAGAERRTGSKRKWLIAAIIFMGIVVCAEIVFMIWSYRKDRPTPEDALTKYFSLLSEKKYEKMYELLSPDSQKRTKKEKFISRNQNIYEGIEAANIKVTLPKDRKSSYRDTEVVTYHTSMDTLAGRIEFDNQMELVKGEDGKYQIRWDSTQIFPSLADNMKVRVETAKALRGKIYDRNGTILASQGAVSEVGLVPGKMSEDREAAIKQVAEILDMNEESIDKKLSASYVKDDTFVPLKKIAQDDEAKQDKLLEIPGVLINSAEDRVYPLGQAAGHLTGYVRPITAEELEEREGEGYTTEGVVGKSGLELAFEEKLRASDGAVINIEDENGQVVETIASQEANGGEDVYLTIDASLQKLIYEEWKDEPGAVVAMNPKNGEVLAMVSTPGYDPNEFIFGISQRRWDELNDSEGQPLHNRYAGTWVPGSTFKPVTAAIGLSTGKIDPEENLGDVGLSWQKDSGWGNYFVTTLTGYGKNVNLENALIYSDNIYFARQALAMGADTLTEGLVKLGFGEKVPFELGLKASSFGEDGKIDSDIQLADTGYGQGQLLVNPLHMLSVYSAFVNGGNMIGPTLLYEEGSEGSVWKEQAITPEAAEILKRDLIQVAESSQGADVRISDVTLLGKTGTAEMKSSQSESGGVERGWFICETTEDCKKPIAVVGLMEDVSRKGGSHYVAKKVQGIVASYEGR